MDYESFKLGNQQIRNLQDWAKKNACSMKDDLVVHYKGSEARKQEPEYLTESQDGDTF